MDTPETIKRRGDLIALEEAKDTIGWSWIEVQKRFSWGPPDLKRVRSYERAIEPEWLAYIISVADAIASVAVPTVFKAPPAPPAEVTQAMPKTTEVHVITMKAVAERLAKQYRDARVNPELNKDEINGALWAIGMTAEALGVKDEVMELLRPAPPIVDINMLTPADIPF